MTASANQFAALAADPVAMAAGPSGSAAGVKPAQEAPKPPQALAGGVGQVGQVEQGKPGVVAPQGAAGHFLQGDGFVLVPPRRAAVADAWQPRGRQRQRGPQGATPLRWGGRGPETAAGQARATAPATARQVLCASCGARWWHGSGFCNMCGLSATEQRRAVNEGGGSGKAMAAPAPWARPPPAGPKTGNPPLKAAFVEAPWHSKMHQPAALAALVAPRRPQEDTQEPCGDDSMGEAQGEVGGLTALAAARRRYSEAKRIHEANKEFGAVGEVLDYLRERVREAKEDLDRLRPTEERLENLRESEQSRIRHLLKLGQDEADAKARLSDVRLQMERTQTALKETQDNIRALETALAAEAAREVEKEPERQVPGTLPEGGATIADLHALAAQAEGASLAKLTDAVAGIHKLLAQKTAMLGGTPGTSKRGRHGVADGEPGDMDMDVASEDLL